MELRTAALRALEVDDPALKVAAVQALDVAAGLLDTQALLQPQQVAAGPARATESGAPQHAAAALGAHPAGRAALLHAVAHIEFNAINLALDAAWRFAGMPEAFYRDWLRVAAEEAYHFTLWPATWPRWAMPTATSTPTTACGR
jgi:uncharacterized ferritin-like protein (DUF455 family)